MYVCVRVRVCVRFSTFQTSITHKRLEISIRNFVHQWSNHNPLIVTIFMIILMRDLWFYGILNFLKKGRSSSNFRKIRAIVLKLHTNILYRSRNFGIEFSQNRLRRSNLFYIEFFENFLNIVYLRQISIYRAKILCVNALILSCVWY